MPSDLPPSDLSLPRARSRGLVLAVAVFSVFSNLLLLTGPLFMLQVYDRVLVARSEETLIALRAMPEFANTPAIFMTAKAQHSDIFKFKDAGALEVIVKPFDPMELAAQVIAIYEASQKS